MHPPPSCISHVSEESTNVSQDTHVASHTHVGTVYFVVYFTTLWTVWTKDTYHQVEGCWINGELESMWRGDCSVALNWKKDRTEFCPPREIWGTYSCHLRDYSSLGRDIISTVHGAGHSQPRWTVSLSLCMHVSSPPCVPHALRM